MPLYITHCVSQLNETMFWYNDCVLRGFLPLHCRPPSDLRRSAYLIPNVGHCVQIHMYAGKSVHLRESCLGENCLRGKCTQLLFLSVSIM